MATTQINGTTQIQDGTVTQAQVDSSVITADGTGIFSADQSLGGHKLTDVGTPVTDADAATKAYVDSTAQGLSPKNTVLAATTGAETYTIASGEVTALSGTSVDGVTLSAGDRLLVKDAPGSSGLGSAASTEPANGIYLVTSTSGGLALTRAQDMTGSINPTGAYVLVDRGTINGATGWVVVSPTPGSAFTYNTTAMGWTKFNPSTGGGGTVTSVGVASANGFSGSVANATSTPSITIKTTVNGMLKANGTAVSAASAGTDYVAPGALATVATTGSYSDLAGAPVLASVATSGDYSDLSGIPSLAPVATAGTYASLTGTPTFVTRETPSGTPNGSTTSFSLAHTLISGSEEVFLNGLLQDPGASNDYQISGANVAFNSAPLSGAKIRVSYRY